MARVWSSGKRVSAQSCPTLCDPMDYSPPGSSVHGVFLDRIMEWVAIFCCRGFFTTQGSNPCLQQMSLYHGVATLPQPAVTSKNV